MSTESRRRWVTLGEAVGIAAVVISALGLWNSYAERRDAHADRAAADGHHAALTLRATPNGDGSVLTLNAVSGDQVIQRQTVRLPPAFALPPATTTSDARIESGWFADALKAQRKLRKLPDAPTGDARLPVLIETDYLDGGKAVRTRALYDIGYVLEGRFLRGTAVRLRGLALIGPAPADTRQTDARLTALWAAR